MLYLLGVLDDGAAYRVFTVGLGCPCNSQQLLQGAHGVLHKHGNAGHLWHTMSEGASLVKHDACHLSTNTVSASRQLDTQLSFHIHQYISYVYGV